MMNETPLPARGRTYKRKNMWELSSHHHCAIVGTCLTIGEDRALGKKIGAKCPDPGDLESVIHSIIVTESKTNNRVSTIQHTLLNKKSETSLKDLHRCNTPIQPRELRREAFEAGNIP